MKRLNEKLKLLFIPFLIIAISTILVYTLLNWFLIIKLQLFSPKEMIVNLWAPLIIPFILVYIWIRPKLKSFNLKRKNGDGTFGYLLIAAMAISAPLIVTQNWLESASGTLLKLDNIKQIEEQNNAKYYILKNFYIDKTRFGVESSFDVSGKYNQDFNMHLYISLPILVSKADTLNSVCFAWIGKEYRRRVSNKLDQGEKEKLFESFAKQSQDEFDQTDFSQFVYLTRMGNTDANDHFKESIKKCLKYNSLHSDVFTAVNEPFENRNGNKFIWIFLAFGIGAVVWFVIILAAKFDDKSIEQIQSEEIATKVGGKNEALSLLIPREGFYITPILLDLNIVIYLVMVFSGLGFMTFETTALLAWGGNYNPVTTNGEWWRLLSSIFLHGGFMHLFANMYALLFVGLFLEPKLGKTKYAIIYLVTGIAASLTSLYFNADKVSVGASGAIFGLYGIFLALLLMKVFPKDFSKTFLSSILIFIGYNLLIGVASVGVDNYAHLGGLISGFIIGIAISPKLKQEANDEFPEQSFKQNSNDTSLDGK